MSSRMTPRTRGVFHGGNLWVGASGVLYAVIKWLVPKPASEFGTAVHPWEPALKALHLATSPLLVFAIGWLWHSHVQGQLRRNGHKKRVSGMSLVLLAAPMVFSGVFYQIAVSEAARTFWSQVHLWCGMAWIAGSLAHWEHLRSILRHGRS